METDAKMPAKQSDKRTLVEVPRDLHSTLRTLADEKGYKINGLVARFIREGLKHLEASA